MADAMVVSEHGRASGSDQLPMNGAQHRLGTVPAVQLGQCGGQKLGEKLGAYHFFQPKAFNAKEVPGYVPSFAAPLCFTVEEQIKACVEKGIITADEGEKVAEYDKLRRDAIITDAFNKDWSKVMPVWTPQAVESSREAA